MYHITLNKDKLSVIIYIYICSQFLFHAVNSGGFFFNAFSSVSRNGRGYFEISC